MARQTRRKTRTKKSLPQRKASAAVFQSRETGLRGREEIRNWKVAVMLSAIFILALFIRVYFNVSEATDDGFKMTGGSDPYYHKRAVDWVTDEHEHLIEDPMLNYPIGIPNPRPPVFDWTMALTGMAMSPFFDGDVEESTWWAVEFIPALFGALIIFPVFFIGKEVFDKRTGLMAAFLISIMAGHVSHTTFGLADHDSFFLFWAAVSIYYFIRSINNLRDGDWVKNWTSLKDIRYGFGNMVKHNKVALGYGLFSGMSMSVIALAWKGFPYIMTIIIAYFLFQLVVNKLKDKDSLNLAFVSLTALAMPLALSAPYYALLGFDSWWTPPLLMLIMAAMASLVMIPTKRFPWLLVFSVMTVFIAISYVLLLFIFKDFGNLVLSGAQYFVRTKLFDTIAEAQPPTFSRIVFSYGVITFFLAFFIGIPFIAYRAFKSSRKDLMFVMTWAILAGYMSQSAVRFIFNGTPIMALLAAWMIVVIVDWVDFRKMLKNIKTHAARGDTVGDKFKAVYRGTGPRHVMGAVLVLFLVVMPNFMGGLDAGIPYEEKKEWDDKIYDFYEDAHLTFMTPDGDDFDREESSTWYLGSFGPSFPNGYWLSYFEWLKQQDNMTAQNERPAFLSWWDYGFWSIELGEHPTVADNFQTGYQFAGNFIAAQSEEEAIGLMVQRLIEATMRNNGGNMDQDIRDILLKNLNETEADGLVHIYKNGMDYETHNVSMVNGRLRAIVSCLTENLTMDELVDTYHDLQVHTGYSIRYFAIDARLFPFTATNNIFYAPVTLADLDVETYLETLYVPGDLDGNPTGSAINASEVEKRVEADPNFRIVDTELRYKKEFFNTMLYKTYVGWYGRDVNMTIDAGIPGVSGELQQQNVMPGWMMQHFREVYRTFYWNPYPPAEVSDHQDKWEPMSYQEAVARGGAQGNISSGMNSGVTSLKYYDGAVVTGQVTTDAGTPLEGIRMTMFDESLIPHDVDFTDSEGRYSLIAPFGQVAVMASKGDMTSSEEYLLQTGSNLLNSSSFNVTDNQAMRLTNWNITNDMVIPSGSVEGQIFWDENDDQVFDSASDRLMDDPTIVLRDIDTGAHYNLSMDSDSEYGDLFPETGHYRYVGIPPGEYELSYKQGAHLRSVKYFVGEDSVYPIDGAETIITKVQDIGIPPASITGTLNYANGTRAERTVTLVDLLDDSEITAQAINGKFLISYLLNGTYQIRVDGDDIYQAHINDIEAVEKEVTDANVTLYPAVTVSGTTYYDGEVRDNVTIYFNATLEGISTSTQSDENGTFSVKLASSTYDVTANEYTGKKFHSDYKRLSFSHSTDLLIDMKDTYTLDGIVYWDRDGEDDYDENERLREEVPDAGIILRGEDFILTGKANGQGKFSFRVPIGRYSIEAVDNETRRTAFEELTLTDDMSRNVQLDDAFAVSGKVITSGWTGDYGSNLIPGVSLEFVVGTESYFASTDENGAYSAYLPEGDYSVTAYRFGYGPETKGILIEENKTLDFTLNPEDVLVEGKITFDGIPVEGVDIIFNNDVIAVSDKDGIYSALLAPDHYVIEFSKISGTTRLYKDIDMTLNVGATMVTLNGRVSEQIKVSGNVLYNNHPEIGDILFDSTDFSTSVSFDGNGDYIAYMTPGDYQVIVNMADNSYVRLLQINGPMTMDMKNSDFSYIRGYVYNDIDQNGFYSGTDDGITAKISFQTHVGHYNDTTSSSGYYTVRIYEESYTVAITADGYEDFEEDHDFTADGQINYLMVPYPVTLTGTVWHDKNANGEMENGEVVGSVPVEVKVKGEDIVYHTMSDANGIYSISLLPGSYSVTGQYSYNGRNFSDYVNTVAVTEGLETVKKDLELRLKFEITGTVNDYLTGTPIDDATVDFLDEHGNTIEVTQTDENGNYLIVISEGDYTLHAHKKMDDRTLVSLERVDITKPGTMDIDLLNGVAFSGTLYTGILNDTIDIGRIDLIGGPDIVLTDSTNADGGYDFLIPAGIYTMQASTLDTDLTPDTEFILNEEVIVNGRYNSEDYNIDLEAKPQFGFTWSVDKTSKSAYIDYTADQYVGAEFTFSITNTGNATQSVALTYDFDNRTYWENINFEPDTIEVKAGKTEEVNFRVRPNAKAPIGRTAVITINATILDEESLSEEMEITVVAKRAKVGDAQIESLEQSPEDDIIEGDEFKLIAEITNPVEFSANINLTAIFERETSGDQWEVVGKNTTTVAYASNNIVEQVVTEKDGTHTYRVRLELTNEDDETDDTNNEETIKVTVEEKPEDELTGWQATLNPVNENAGISWLVLITLVMAIAAILGYTLSSKRKRRGRRYKRRHSR